MEDRKEIIYWKMLEMWGWAGENQRIKGLFIIKTVGDRIGIGIEKKIEIAIVDNWGNKEKSKKKINRF